MTAVLDLRAAQGSAGPPTRAELGRALRDGSLEVVFEPVVDVAGRRPVGAKATLCWHRAVERLERGAFWHLTDALLAQHIGAFVLDAACREVAAWRGHVDDARVAVAVDARELSRDWAHAVLTTLQRHRVPTGALTLQVTGGRPAGSVDVAACAAALLASGVGVGVDNAGAGVDALAMVRDLPLSELMIGREFVAALGQPRGDAVVRALVALARGLGLRTVAAGVETEEQAAWLAAEGVVAAQGRMFGGPMSADATRAYWRTQHGSVAGSYLRHLYDGGSSLATIAALLNQRAIPAPSGRRWHPRAVARAIDAEAGHPAGPVNAAVRATRASLPAGAR